MSSNLRTTHIDTENINAAIAAYKKANPATAKAIATYKKISTARTAQKLAQSNYRAGSSTQLSTVYTTK